MFLLFACTKQVDYLLDESESVPVIQSIMCPDSVVTVYVAQSVSTLAKGFNFIDDATVLLYCEDVFVDTLVFNSDKYYSSVYPEAGKRYKIVVEMPNGKTVWGETTIPTKPIACNPVLSHSSINYEGQWYKLELQINDTSLSFNYYELVMFYSHGNSISYYNNTAYFLEMDKMVINEGDWGFNPHTIFFSDVMFNGKKYNFSCITSMHNGSFGSGVDPDSVYFKDLYTSLRNTSYSYYKFRKSFTRHIYNSGIQTDGLLNLISTGNPVDMYSNVNGGLGIVASYNQIVEEFKGKP